jgi:branched-chain amino acid transport system ATP-binding protein
MSDILRLEHVSASYGQARALTEVSFRVAEGEVVGVLGRNGAGKTTLLRAIAGHHHSVTGEIQLNGQAVFSDATSNARRGISMVRENAAVLRTLTVNENLDVGARLAQLRGKESPSRSAVWDWFPLLEPLRTRRAGVLSGGERQSLALATAFLSVPEILLLDEPSAGLAPVVAHATYETIRRMASAGMTVLVVEQAAGWLDHVANRIYLLELGQVAREFTAMTARAQSGAS